MAAKYILAALAFVFLVLAVSRIGRTGGTPQRKTWLIIGILFALVSAWLFYQG